MARVSVTVPHQLTPSEARSRLDDVPVVLEEQYGDRVTVRRLNWRDDTHGEFGLFVMKIPVSGYVEVRPSEVRVDVDLPMAMAPFQGQLESSLRRQGERLLNEGAEWPRSEPLGKGLLAGS